jgi:hypothetical protein
MNASMRSGWVALLGLCLGVAAQGCGSKDAKTDASSSAAASTTAKADSSSKTAATTSSANAGKDEVDVNALLDDQSKDDESGELPVNLPDDSAASKATSIGGDKPPPPPKDSSAKLTWVPAGSYDIPNPGFKQEEKKDFLFLGTSDKKGGAIFTTWKDPNEAKTKFEGIIKAMNLKDFKLKQKPKPVVVGPDKIPAYLGGGHLVEQDGKTGKLAYILLKGQPNILGIAGVDDDAPADEQNLVFATLGYIRKHKQ